MPEINDEQLVKKYLKGDEKSLEILIQQYLKPVYNFIYHYVNSASDAEDITQEVFVKMWRNLKKPALSLSKGFDPEKGKLKTWLFSIAKNASIDFLRRKKTLSFSVFTDEKGDNIITDTLKDSSLLPDEIFEQKNATQSLFSAIKKLSPKYRLVLDKHYNDDLTFREIAQSLNEPLHTIKSRYRRALISLKKFLVESI
ncbi:MAG: sigma-70 family RNA polymerase sigma factor [Patescibacteria group bacterium]|nr:sigma-70 family RNA polymerase sigma factor [Patescibacteria group bacterium]MDD5164401.1 sigma-70 family RNA polymerase sigma factor [Patescibacteria group bacterium]MDD5534947.1 sigma-70 family RNA polymerase sigma factor [Patescibacteria group bacterium]